MRIVFTIFIVLVSLDLFSQTEAEKTLHAGNEFYRNQKYEEAAVQYSKVLQSEPNNTTARFNQANSLYKQDKKVDAVQLYAELTTNSQQKDLVSKAWYNKGVILTDQKNLEESIEAYKHALRNNPDDKEARENLQKALLELKKKKEEQKNEDQQQQEKKQEQKQQSSSKMQPKEAEQRLRLLQQKEKEVQERVQKQKSKTGVSMPRDW